MIKRARVELISRMWDRLLSTMHYNQKALKDKPEYRGNTYEFIEKLMKIDKERK